MKTLIQADRTYRDGQRITKLLRCADKGDRAAISELRELFNADPELWEQAGNIAFQAEVALVNATAGDNKAVEEALHKMLAAMKEELAGPMPTPLERLLVERVVACWLQVSYADAKYVQQMTNLTMDQGDYHQRRQDRAHRRYLLAIRTLAQVRRLLIPVVQVNIGNQQVNAAQVTTCAGG